MFIRRYDLMAPADDEGLAAAISTAVEQARPADARTETTTDDGDEGAQETPSGDETGSGDRGAAAEGAPADDASQAQPDATQQADAAAAAPKPGEPGSKHRADGTFKSKDELERDKEAIAAAEAAKSKAPKADVDAATGKPKGAKQPSTRAPDHVNDPIPAELKGKTRERMEGLVKVAKEITTERDRWKGEAERLYNAIADTGTTAEEFGDMMETQRLLHSDDVAERRKGLAELRKWADGVAEELGETPTGKDPLAGHQDLLDKVEDGDITRELALELAEARNRKAADSKLGERRDQQTKEQREYQEAVETARTDLNTLGAQLKQANPTMYAHLSRVLAEEIKEIRDTMHPSKWASTFKRRYEAAAKTYSATTRTAAPADTRERAPRGTGGAQPMRPKQGAGGGGAKEPQSLEEAINFGINQAARR